MDAYPFVLHDRLKGLLLYSVVAPSPRLRRDGFNRRFSPSVIDYDSAPVSSLGLVGASAAVVFLSLIALGLASALRSPRRDVAFAALGFLLFHIVLHLIYGELVFLYAMHSVPSLAAVLAFALAGPWSRIAMVLALLFIVVGGPHNLARYHEVAELALLLARLQLTGGGL